MTNCLFEVSNPTIYYKTVTVHDRKLRDDWDFIWTIDI